MLAAYLVGSLSFAVIVSRVDGPGRPAQLRLGNPGATNVLRSGNSAAAVLTLALDALKGYVPVLLVPGLGAALRPRARPPSAFVGLAAFLGHLWPVFFRFQGGKGVATAAGVLMALNPWLGAGHAGHLGHRRGLLPLFVAGLAGGGRLRAVLPAADLGRWSRRMLALIVHEPAAGLAPRRQHPQAAGRHRDQARPEGRRRRRAASPHPPRQRHAHAAARPRHRHRKGHH